MDLERRVERHALAAAEQTYARLGCLPPDRALVFARERLVSMLRDPESSIVQITHGDAIAALGVARPLPEDSHALGKRIGTAAWLSVDASLEQTDRRRVRAELLDECQLTWRERFDLVTLLVDFDRAETIEALQVRRARIYGANATWAGPVSRIADRLLDHPSSRRATMWEGAPGPLLECVAESFGSYRSHYHGDGRLNAESASASYVEAVRRHVERGGCTVVVERDGKIEAFSTIGLHDEVNRWNGTDEVGEIELSGTSALARTPGVYEMTLRRAMAWYRDSGVRFVVLGSKADNFAVQQAWIRLGALQPRRFRYRLHWWLDS